MQMILYALAFLFLAAVGLWLLMHVLSMAYYVGWMLFWLLLLLFMLGIAWSIVKPKLPKLAMKKTVKYKVFDARSPHIYAFRIEPTLKDIAMLHDELHIAQLELAGDVIQLNNDTAIKIVEDTGKEAVRIKIKGTKSKEKEFWVARSAIVPDQGDNPKLLG